MTTGITPTVGASPTGEALGSGTPANVPATAAERLARFATELCAKDIPEQVRAMARAHLLDGIGIALASSGMDFTRPVLDTALALGDGGRSHVIGYGTRLPAASAALVNGTLVHALDFDDTHIGAIYHATAPALAAALAVAEEQEADGESLLTAYVIGLEIGCRVAGAGAGSFHDRGFHPTGIAGTFAAAAVAARLRGLDTADTVSALGICGSQAAGTLELAGSSLKRLHPGWAAHSGIVAATLAASGFAGPPTIFEGPRGLFASHLGMTPAEIDLGLDDLGNRWMCADTALKPYPCCHFTHAFVDAALDLRSQLGGQPLKSTEIEEIICPTTPRIMPSVTEPAERKKAPRTLYEAQFSVQYIVAQALVSGRVDLATFYDQPLDDPDVLAVAAKVGCPPDPDSDFPVRFPGEVILRLADGRELRRRIPTSSGTPGNPLDEAVVLGKFRSNAGRVLAADQVRQIEESVGELDSLADLTDLMRKCGSQDG
ncbi:MmgE/PrpD family protein [Streptomyces sp. NBC_00006]|uniref:MmgE/PrpD family protein n=1 Tax=Streptomyces sp. NBC_00006 TaxID=2975619 RepID=UPI00225C0B5B|nr:MmgE/PrpD family protein [Streptomyces sp. NBC_00006]MCX5535840.1 MmgE/PrpD family protein [Streptomyces sp. NBC_00006]